MLFLYPLPPFNMRIQQIYKDNLTLSASEGPTSKNIMIRFVLVFFTFLCLSCVETVYIDDDRQEYCLILQVDIVGDKLYYELHNVSDVGVMIYKGGMRFCIQYVELNPLAETPKTGILNGTQYHRSVNDEVLLPARSSVSGVVDIQVDDMPSRFARGDHVLCCAKGEEIDVYVRCYYNWRNHAVNSNIVRYRNTIGSNL